MNCTRHRLGLPSHLVQNHLSVFFKSIISFISQLFFHKVGCVPSNWQRHGCFCVLEQLSGLLLNTPELRGPSALSAARLAELSPLLPLLGLPFLEGLDATELLAALPALTLVSFSPVQVRTAGRLSRHRFMQEMNCFDGSSDCWNYLFSLFITFCSI